MNEMSGYDAWLEAPYQEMCDDEEREEARVEENYDAIIHELSAGTLETSMDFASEHCENECYDLMASLLQGYSQNLHLTNPTAFAKIVTDMMDEVVNKAAVAQEISPVHGDSD